MHPCRFHFTIAMMLIAVVYCRDNNNDNDIRLLRVMQAAPVGSSSSSYNSMGSADDDYGEQNVMDDDKSTSTSTDDCVIPCGHIYDPVCAVEEDTIVGGGGDGDNAIEVREFPNECSMHRFNCEWQKNFRVADPEQCFQSSDAIGNGAVTFTMLP